MTDNVFALDANVFIEAHRRYYGLDLCPGFWECLRHFGDLGRLLTIDRVRAELLRGGDALSQWIRASPEGLFVSSGQPAVVETFIEMMDWVETNGQFRGRVCDVGGWLVGGVREGARCRYWSRMNSTVPT